MRTSSLLRAMTFLLLAGSFFAAGSRLVDGRIYDADAFDADGRRVVHDIGRVGGSHYRTKVHPLFVLLVNPPGALLKAIVGRPRTSALLLDAAAGAAGVLLLHVLLGRLGIGRTRAVLWSLLFATSASQVFFSVVPETYAFSGAGLLLSFLVFASPVSRRPARVASAVVSFGVTVTNLAATLALAWFCSAGREASGRALAVARLGVLVIALGAGLSLVQKACYPEAELFFVRSSVAEEASYLFRSSGLPAVADRVASLGANLVFVNLAAPRVETEPRTGEPPAARFGRPRPAGWLHALVWATLCALAAGGLWKAGWHARDGVVAALLAWIAFNVALHLVYGQTLFLYSCHWTFAVIAVVAVGLEWSRSRFVKAGTTAALCLLVALQLSTSVGFVRELYELYG
jgi:hypothetical protein